MGLELERARVVDAAKKVWREIGSADHYSRPLHELVKAVEALVVSESVAVALAPGGLAVVPLGETGRLVWSPAIEKLVGAVREADKDFWRSDRHYLAIGEALDDVDAEAVRLAKGAG